MGKYFAILIVVFAAFPLAASAGSKASQMEHAKQVIVDGMIDPASTQFRYVHIGNNDAVCGEVNSKNRFGGYIGFSRFAVAEDGVWIIQDDGSYESSLAMSGVYRACGDGDFSKAGSASRSNP